MTNYWFYRFQIALTVFLLFSGALLEANGNNNKIDSLNVVIENYLQKDSLKPAIEVLNEILDIYEYEGNWTSYDSVVAIMINYANETGDKEILGHCYNQQGIACCLNGRNPEALKYFKLDLELNTELGKEQWVSNSLENMGLVYKDMGKYNEALECQMKSLVIREKYDHPRLANSYSNVSQLFEFIGEPQKQLIYLRKAFNTAKRYPDNLSLQAVVYCEMGEYFMDHNELDSCFQYFNEGLICSEKIEWKRGISVFLGDLAEAYILKGDLNKSIEMHQKSLVLSLEINDCTGICQEYNSLSKLYLETNKSDMALAMNQKALELGKKHQLDYEYLSSLEYASKLYEKKGDKGLALDYFKRYHALNDSLFNIEKQGKILELEATYQTEKKEQQIELLSTENELKSQRIKTFIAIVVALLLASGIGLVLYFLRQRKARQREEVLKQQLLRSQMNPHFIFNALGSIQNYMLHNEPQKAAGYLGNFASLTRSILENSAKELISLDDEISMLKNYIELERMRLKGRFIFELHVDEDLDTEFIAIPPMMIQPFVENAIKHGLKEKTVDGILSLTVSEMNGQIVFELRDNGMGIEMAKLSKKEGHRSMSMQIFEERKRLIEKRLKKKFVYSVTDLKNSNQELTGTMVNIYFPQLCLS